jgi:hypothetical protein
MTSFTASLALARVGFGIVTWFKPLERSAEARAIGLRE